MRRLAAVPILAALFCALPAAESHAQPGAAGITRNPQALSDTQLESRLLFLEERLDARRGRARLWNFGWTGAYSMGIVLGTAQAVRADDDDERVDSIVTAVKGVIGTARFAIWPHTGIHGAGPMRAVPGDSRDARLARLAVGERLLLSNVRRANLRATWLPHGLNVGINLAGAAVIAGVGDPVDAAVSFAVGTAVGAIAIYTSPTSYRGDLEEYESRFTAHTRRRFQWQVVPTLGGAALHVRF